jgi:quercetin dioxygenase-like cupin family protein
MDIKEPAQSLLARGPAQYFTEMVRVDPLFEAPPPAPFSARASRLSPASAPWHTHPLGQTLIVTAGCSWAQRWGGPVEEIRPGDVIWFSARSTGMAPRPPAL